MTNTQLKKHENKIKNLLTKLLKWVIKNVNSNKDIEKRVNIQRREDYYLIEYILKDVFDFCVEISPEEYNLDDEKVDGGVKCWVSLKGLEARSLNIDIKLNEKNEAYCINTFMDYTRNVFEFKSPKLDKIIKDSVLILNKSFKEKKEKKSLEKLNTLKAFIEEHNV